MKQTPPSPLADQIVPEKATAFLFYKSADLAQKQFFTEASGLAKDYRNLVVKAIPAAQAAQYGVIQLPVAVVLDRRGREVGRASTAFKLAPLFRKASNVGRIDWAMEGEPSGEAVKRVVRIPNVEQLPGILRTMSLNPEAMMGIQGIANLMHFRDSALPRRQKEMVAAYVSALNKCKY
ncbi:MAG: hypothetical protein QM758_25390 [Armatimonas sp.]